jgi:rubredoxin
LDGNLEAMHGQDFLVYLLEQAYYLNMGTRAEAKATITCQVCKLRCESFGKHRNGLRRFRCGLCGKTYTEAPGRAAMRNDTLDGEGRHCPEASGRSCQRPQRSTVPVYSHNYFQQIFQASSD